MFERLLRAPIAVPPWQSPSSPRFASAIVFGSLVLLGCGDGGGTGGTGPTSPVQVATVEINPSTHTFTALDLSHQLTAVARDAEGNVISGKEFTWASSNANVAFVNWTNGVVTSVSNGSSTITATVDGKAGSCVVTVDQVLVGVSVEHASITLNALDTERFIFAQAWDSNGRGMVGLTFAWASSDPSVVQVESVGERVGRVSPVSDGNAVITASAEGMQASVDVTVSIKVAIEWEYETGDGVFSSPAVGVDGTVYVGSYDGKLYAINPDGTKKWEFLTGGPVGSSPAIGADGTIYVGSSDSKLYAINPDGTKKWDYAKGEVGLLGSSPAVGTDGTVYIGSWNQSVYAVNPDGTTKWEFLTGGPVGSSPAIAADGTIYIGSFDSKLNAINPDGTGKWEFLTGEGVWSSPAIGSDGAVYVGSVGDP
ncbi:MAG: PQQ-binding-like beta-propeller repeat protein, partial [Gemmatimonadota bacterium]